jgi:hypothetical protein
VLLFGAISATPVYALMAFGVTLGVMGHILKDNKIVAIGLVILFAATALLFLGAQQAYQEQGALRLWPGARGG